MLQEDGWVHVATKGSHWQITHSAKPGRVTVPHPNKDIPRGTVASIYRQAGWNASGGRPDALRIFHSPGRRRLRDQLSRLPGLRLGRRHG
ncbi:MAG: type II toxin-antitoxin system HicA family toxin [Bryobacterales bacterium]|nr:type II toxin-antitoxin system HicA family toxin [Bryobacterales bacterium]